MKNIKALIDEVIENSLNGSYVYRGEPESYDEVSSGLWRCLKGENNNGNFDINNVPMDSIQGQILNDVTNYARGSSADFETISALQHYGGWTNLIDFSADYLTALYFGCDRSENTCGRLILLERTPEIDEKYRIKEPLNPQNRIIAQKSIFVRPPKGYLDPQDYEIISIESSLKKSILNYLHKYHGISESAVYNDLHGFITIQRRHKRALMEYAIATILLEEGRRESVGPHQTTVF